MSNGALDTLALKIEMSHPNSQHFFLYLARPSVWWGGNRAAAAAAYDEDLIFFLSLAHLVVGLPVPGFFSFFFHRHRPLLCALLKNYDVIMRDFLRHIFRQLWEYGTLLSCIEVQTGIGRKRRYDDTRSRWLMEFDHVGMCAVIRTLDHRHIKIKGMVDCFLENSNCFS